MSLNIAVTARLNIIKNLLSLFLITTLALTWTLWSGNRTYPLFPGAEALQAMNVVLTYALPVLLILSLLFALALRRPRLFLFFSLLAGATLLFLDTGRMHYWFYFYLLVLAILLGYNWRVDNANHYFATFNALKWLTAFVYLAVAVQHFQAGFVHQQWPAFIKPFERFWTPEQCAYLLKLAYAVPFIELFIVAGLFIGRAKIAAISFATLFHLFSIVVLSLQPVVEPAVITWHIFMIALVFSLFGGSLAGPANAPAIFSMNASFALLFTGLLAPVYLWLHNKPLENKIDLMQVNAHNQYIYVSEQNKNRLPLYVQSFALTREDGYHKLNLTAWSLHELKTRQVLNAAYLMKFTSELNRRFGIDALVSLPADVRKNGELALK